jgi:LDH2 family malate/lactate/ureidoglycolate dehydrogenase
LTDTNRPAEHLKPSGQPDQRQEAEGPRKDAERVARIGCGEIERFSRAALAATGADAETVDAVTRALLHASVLGVDTHGFRLLPHYLACLEQGRINKTPRLRIVHEKGGACVLDADDAHGARASYAAVEKAAELATRHGLGAVAIRSSSHFGAAGAYSSALARRGMVGFAFCNSDALVRLHGGAMGFHGTNPISVAAPTGGDPWLLDMATSSIPFNNVYLRRALGEPLPGGVASDAAGQPTTDAALAAMLVPLGGEMFGYKGAGLAGISEILSSALGNSPLSIELPRMVGGDLSKPRKLGAFVMALDPDAFSGGDVFREVMTRYLAILRGSAMAPGGRVMAPGDREWAEAARRRELGIVLDRTSFAALSDFAASHGLAPLEETHGA